MESLAQNFLIFLLIVGIILLPGILVYGGQWLLESYFDFKAEEEKRKKAIPPLK